MIILVTDVLVLAKVAFSHSLALQPRFQLVQYLPDITIGQMFKNKDNSRNFDKLFIVLQDFNINVLMYSFFCPMLIYTLHVFMV